jgi:hypothetical protein
VWDDLPEDVIYPHSYSGFPLCAQCFQRTPDLATGNPDPNGPLLLLCGACHRALATGQPIVLPTGDVLAETWERLARLRQNREITDVTIATAIEMLAPELTPEQATDAVLQLTEALLALQHIRSDRFDPADGDRDYLEGEADRDRKNALAKLMVGDLTGVGQ